MNSKHPEARAGEMQNTSRPAWGRFRKPGLPLYLSLGILFVILLACDLYLARQIFAPTPRSLALLTTASVTPFPHQNEPDTSTLTQPANTETNTPLPSDTLIPSLTPAPTFTDTPSITDTPLPSATSTPPPNITIHFAVIGDYGEGNQAERDVSDLVNSWKPDFILTTGDNNYPLGEEKTIDDRVGQYYHNFIYPYSGSYESSASSNRFFPTLGNHDWMSNHGEPYFEYFTLPGNERYYDFSWGPVHFYALDSDTNEPDSVGVSSVQAAWLKQKLAQATQPWRVVYSHFPAYSSGLHGPSAYIRWPFQEWGANVYLSGHDHDYERLDIGGFPYIVDGLGGGPIYDFKAAVAGSRVRFNQDYGALLVSASYSQMKFQFFTRKGLLVDEFTLNK